MRLASLLLSLILVFLSECKHDDHNNMQHEKIVKHGGESSVASKATSKDAHVDPKKLYMELFKARRREHAVAIQSIVGIEIAKQRLFVEELIINIKKILEEARSTLDRTGFTAGSPFPQNSDTLKDALSKVLENTAFFSDIAARFPLIVRKQMNRDRKLNTVIVWAHDMSTKSGLLDETTIDVVQVMATELEIIPRPADFKNAFDTTIDKDELQREAIRQAEERKAEKEKEKKAERKKKKNGPSVSKTEL